MVLAIVFKSVRKKNEKIKKKLKIGFWCNLKKLSLDTYIIFYYISILYIIYYTITFSKYFDSCLSIYTL